MKILSKKDKDLVGIAKAYLKKRYKKNAHHVACAMRCGSKVYLSAHLDIRGFDVCAEPIAVSNALSDGQTSFNSIVTVCMTESGPEIVSPCGNCRQMFVTYSPEIEVILNDNGKISKERAINLLPIPY